MSLSNKPLEIIDESDLQSLVNNQRLESKTIEYKESLPDNSDSDKKEFLAEVSSFANTAGGDLISYSIHLHPKMLFLQDCRSDPIFYHG